MNGCVRVNLWIYLNLFFEIVYSKEYLFIKKLLFYYFFKNIVMIGVNGSNRINNILF